MVSERSNFWPFFPRLNLYRASHPLVIHDLEFRTRRRILQNSGHEYILPELHLRIS